MSLSKTTNLQETGFVLHIVSLPQKGTYGHNAMGTRQGIQTAIPIGSLIRTAQSK